MTFYIQNRIIILNPQFIKPFRLTASHLRKRLSFAHLLRAEVQIIFDFSCPHTIVCSIDSIVKLYARSYFLSSAQLQCQFTPPSSSLARSSAITSKLISLLLVLAPYINFPQSIQDEPYNNFKNSCFFSIQNLSCNSLF